jgi:uncharacterized protein (TIGR04222 family)
MDNRLREINSQHEDLYRRILEFSFDQPGTQVSFCKKLERENGWSLSYTQRVIEEYKKFVFLAVASGYPVSPSDQVDQVWHLHLSYSRSYWQEFCPNVLQAPLHHEPSRGGSSEQSRFDKMYSQTLESYEQVFGKAPPSDIWPPLKSRLARDIHLVRIDRQKNWVLPKPNLKILAKIRPRKVEILPLLLFLSFAVTSCQSNPGVPNPLDLTGPDFLVFYSLIGIIGIALSFWLRYSLRLPSDAPNSASTNLSAYEVAFLTGGNGRMISTALVSLMQKGYVAVHPRSLKLTLKKAVDDSCDSMERLVAKKIDTLDGGIDQLIGKSKNIGDEIRDRLQKFGLIVVDRQSLKVQIYPALIMFSLLGIGALKTFVGISRGKPVSLLLLCMFVFLIFGIILLVRPFRSRYGDRVLKDLIAESEHLKIDLNLESQLPLAFALFGGTVLSGESAFADVRQFFTSSGVNGGSNSSSGDSSSGDSSSGSCGGGGGCGGGCGGCSGG